MFSWIGAVPVDCNQAVVSTKMLESDGDLKFES